MRVAADLDVGTVRIDRAVDVEMLGLAASAAASSAAATAASATTRIMMWLTAAPATARAFVVVLSWSHDPVVIRYRFAFGAAIDQCVADAAEWSPSRATRASLITAVPFEQPIPG